ncbi:helix-turn-helix transcriptional regulator [Pseudoalteromonas obscura]|uniref:AraC family transcriptional regulator n=1 Tax=Pseudoalteromonas obscura TaxID=3048491 RepID=A0ABT7EIE0_9GAMM|nr:AraC family transcriptional regulator [Pseudoalteromonas sp. P94(2023)]MDK2594826.1 AraC family transcriptional regulator [Pseudoalteromonas sp. P94(2023)]
MTNSNVWIKTGLVLTYGESIDADYHSHLAMQLIWPDSDAMCILNGETLQSVAIIDSRQTHCLSMTKGWVLLIEPSSMLGQSLKERLNSQSWVSMPILQGADIELPIKHQGDAFGHFASLLAAINLDGSLLDTDLSIVTDPRIGELLDELNLCFTASCTKPNQWRAKEVAQKCHLSESRFLHLFSQQVGIAWRPYLLWRRMICALQMMMNGATATEAAYGAGFSDSAHLSRTFRSTFGMTIRQAKSLLIS